ncbi:hypothetical protein F511_29267 [Dorcoceras hygrometricum]|uniref:Uncharacterized protein n=1 Tax=Dorcoceras hygrometricum TaxID=472368 RepID=A0A2Z7BUW4_9LAMI|nr:hypothetical protein F511_29267 [Dorcoceras hygrometricum]
MNIVIWTRARWAAPKTAASLTQTRRRRRRRLAPPPRVSGIRFGRFDEENPFVQNSSVILVQPDEGVSVLVVDRIGDYLPQSTDKSRVLVIPVGARHKCQQGIRFERPISENENQETTTGPPPRVAALAAARFRAHDVRFRAHAAQHHAHRLRMVAEALAVSCACWPIEEQRLARVVALRCPRSVATLVAGRCDDGRGNSARCRARRASRLRYAGRSWSATWPEGGCCLCDAGWTSCCAPVAQRCEAGRALAAVACAYAARAKYFVAAPPASCRSGDAPASFRRCHDGWSEFF